MLGVRMDSRVDERDKKRRSKRDKSDSERAEKSTDGKGDEHGHRKDPKSPKKSKKSKRSRSTSPVDRENSRTVDTKVKSDSTSGNTLSPSQTFDNTRNKSDKPSSTAKTSSHLETSAESGPGERGGGGHQEELSIEETK